MQVDRAILASGATVQFSSLALTANPHTRIIGFAAGMLTGTVLLLSAIDMHPFRFLAPSKRKGKIEERY